jgi:23S rRNA pseudouridine1911/1915/1917 synthase
MKKNKLDILFEDKNLLIVNKPSGLLTIATDKQKDYTLYSFVYDYLRKKNQRIFIVHRLDKDTSGIVLFAKTEKAKTILQDNWDKVKRGYVAVLEGHLKENKGTIKNYLSETKTFLTYISTPKDGKLAITDYELIKCSKTYSLVKIELKTGRKNQIRVGFSDLGNPIVGDKKYGAKKNPLGILALYANYLEFTHPITHQNKIIDLGIPEEFLNLVK